jgi:hypothetical protein
MFHKGVRLGKELRGPFNVVGNHAYRSHSCHGNHSQHMGNLSDKSMNRR